MIFKQQNCHESRYKLVSAVTILSTMVLFSCSSEEPVPDFSGIYEHGHAKSSRGGDGLYLNDVQPTAEAQALMDAFDPADDFVIQCEPPGPKRQWLHPYPLEITQTEDRIDIWYEGWSADRTIYLNAEFPDQIEPSKLGYSIGHFEGNDLVVETIGHMGGFINEITGLQYSEDAHFIERYTRYSDPEDSHIELNMVITDARRFSEPMIIGDAWTWNPEFLLLDYECLIPEEHGIGR